MNWSSWLCTTFECENYVLIWLKHMHINYIESSFWLWCHFQFSHDNYSSVFVQLDEIFPIHWKFCPFRIINSFGHFIFFLSNAIVCVSFLDAQSSEFYLDISNGLKAVDKLCKFVYVHFIATACVDKSYLQWIIAFSV